MAVTEIHRALGTWNLQLSVDTPRSVLDRLVYLGHITIHTGRVQPELVGDGLLNTSEFTGVLRSITISDDQNSIGGPGMAFWLGDEDGKGSVYEDPMVFTAVLPATAVAALLPASGAVTAGTLHAVAGLYTGTHQWQDPRTAIDYVATTMGAEWRVNGDGTLDFGTTEQLFVTDPKCLVVRRGVGVDDWYRALQGRLSLSSDVEDFTTRVVLLAQGAEAATLTATADIAPGLNPYKDVHGNPVELTRMVSESTTDATNAEARAQLQLNRFSGTRDAMRLSAGDYDVFGAARAGDYVFVFDPDAGMFDLDNEVVFRGERLYPAKLRLTEVTWPVRPGRMVAYRGPDGTWLDLTDYVVWESGDATLTVGDYNRNLLSSGEVVGTRPVADTSVPAAPTWVEPFLQGVYQSPDTGQARGSTILAWLRPDNTDGSTILDGSHYEIRYRTTSVPVYPVTWDQFEAAYSDWDDMEAAGATWDSPIVYDTGEWQHTVTGFDQLTFRLQELLPAHPYEAQIRAVDMANPPNVSAWSSSAFFQTINDNLPPATPAAPEIAASILKVQMVHRLGVASGGTFNLDRDLHHLELHGGPEPLFTPVDDTLLGKVLANYGMIVGEIPVVATFPLDDLDPVYFKVIAVDEAGNKSLPSEAVVSTVDLVDDAHIDSLTVSKLTAGEMTADVIVGGRIATMPVLGFPGVEMDSNGLRGIGISGSAMLNWQSNTGKLIVNGNGGIEINDGRLVVKNASGNTILELGECADGRHGVQVYKDDGTRVARMGELASGAEGIEVVDDLGNLVRVSTLAFGWRASSVATAEDRIGVAFGDMITAGPEVTVTVGNSRQMVVMVGSWCNTTGTGSLPRAAFQVSGPSGYFAAASTFRSVSIQGTSGSLSAGASKAFLVDGLPQAGNYTVRMVYSSGSGTNLAQFADRHLVVMPF